MAPVLEPRSISAPQQKSKSGCSREIAASRLAHRRSALRPGVQNHKETDSFCRQRCDPKLHTEVATDANHEACEQTFRWWRVARRAPAPAAEPTVVDRFRAPLVFRSRFKLMANHMNLNKASFFLWEMAWLHNERTLFEECESTDMMPSARLAEVRAAYGLKSVQDTPQARTELADALLKGGRKWDAALLDTHREKAGGKWRELAKTGSHARGAKRKHAAGEAGSSSSAGEGKTGERVTLSKKG